MRLPILLAALLAMAMPAAAQQAPSGVLLTGRAQTGTDTRDVRFELFCSQNGRGTTGLLAIDLHVPRHEQLAPVFDFDPFEGPDANAGQRTRLETPGGGNARFAVSGSIGVAEDVPFVFSLAAARRRDAPRLAALARVLRPLTAGPSQLVWTQENTRRGGPAIVARLDGSAEDSVRLRTLLAPCLAAP
ncbi:MAG: hypothetical protein JWR10_2636 [Rubritepida sp.]|nr:hypothetical protein [Rubritepida sp.]